MKNISRLATLVMFSILLASCGNSEDKLAQQYIDACAQNDYAAANAVIDKMQLDSEHGKKYDMRPHMKYVFNKELYYLVAQGDQNSANQLLFLINNKSAFFRGDEIMNLAITQGNDVLANKLIEKGIGCTLDNVRAACNADMPEIVKKFVNRKLEFFDDNEVQSYLQESAPEIYTALRNKRIEKAKEEIKSKIDDLAEIKIDLSSGGLPTGLHVCTTDLSKWVYDYDKGSEATYEGDKLEYKYVKYIDEIKNHNSNCIDLMNKALSYDLKQEALECINCMRQNMKAYRTNQTKRVVYDTYNGYCYNCAIYKISYDNEDINEAVRKYKSYGK